MHKSCWLFSLICCFSLPPGVYLVFFWLNKCSSSCEPSKRMLKYLKYREALSGALELSSSWLFYFFFDSSYPPRYGYITHLWFRCLPFWTIPDTPHHYSFNRCKTSFLTKWLNVVLSQCRYFIDESHSSWDCTLPQHVWWKQYWFQNLYCVIQSIDLLVPPFQVFPLPIFACWQADGLRAEEV